MHEFMHNSVVKPLYTDSGYISFFSYISTLCTSFLKRDLN